VARHLWGDTSLEGRHVVVSGVGKVGTTLVGTLVEEQARVTVADVDPAAVARVTAAYPAAEAVAVEEAHRVRCDIFSPCALGGVLDATTIPELRCTAVVGSANNQLADPGCGKLLAEAGVLYATDYVVNAGGVINIAEELAPGGYNRERAVAAVGRIFDTTAAMLATAESEGVSTAEAADRLAERRIDDLARVHQIRTAAPW
jgi:valine dehydrogenase (NAD+)